MNNRDIKEIDWEKANTRGLGFKTLSDPDFFNKVLENNKGSNRNASANNAQNKESLSAQKNVSQTNTQKNERTSTPRFGNTFDLQNTQNRRRQSYGMDLLSRNKSTVQPPMTRKISALDPDEEEFTPAGEKAFLEGFNEGYEKYNLR